MLGRVFAFAGASLLAASGFAQFAGGQVPGQAVQWTTAAQGFECSIRQPEWKVIGSQSQWERHFRRMYAIPDSTKPVIPRVADWNQEMVVAIHAGAKPNPGYSVHVSTISRVPGGNWLIEVTLTEPHLNSKLPDRETSPWVVIRVKRTTGTPDIRATVVRSGFAVIAPGDPWCGSKPQGEVPVWRVGPGGTLIPVNDAARRALGENTKTTTGG
jgi:hypothetical protein